MATQIKNTLAIDLAPGAEVDLVHGLNNGTIPVVPDIIFIPSPDLELSGFTDEKFTVRNEGAVRVTGAILVEWWHTVERAFGDSANENLPVKPYIVVGVESSGSPPQPPFQEVEIVIYARLTGSDATGNGTLANPYRTFQRAVRDVPNFIPPGVLYVVDITGIGVETLPDNYVLPSWKSAYVATGYNGNDLVFYGIAAVRLRAYPQLASALSPANQVINAGVQTSEPVTGFLTITDPTKTWVPGALVGLFAKGTATPGDAFFDKAPIVANTATSITVAHDAASWTLPISIVELSATLEGKNTVPSFGNGAIDMGSQDSLAIQGIRIRPTDLLSPEPSFGFQWSGGSGFPELCHLVFGEFGLFPGGFEFTSCIVEGGALIQSTAASLFSRFLGGIDGISFLTSKLLLFVTTFEGCNPVGASDFSLLANVLIKDALGAGFSGGFFQLLFDSQIDDSAEDAILINAAGTAVVFGVVGTGNGGVGIHVTDGGHVTADADAAAGPTTVTGVGGDQQVGELVAGAYPAAPFNIVDVFAGVNPNMTGTDARFNTP